MLYEDCIVLVVGSDLGKDFLSICIRELCTSAFRILFFGFRLMPFYIDSEAFDTTVVPILIHDQGYQRFKIGIARFNL